MPSKYRDKYAADLFRLIKRLEAEGYSDHEQLTNMRIEYRAMISNEELKGMGKTHWERHKFRNLGHKREIQDWKTRKQLIEI